MSDLKKEVLDLVHEAYDNRLMPRLRGLTDEEYLWEPVPDCWTVHPNGNGTFRADWGFIFSEVPPFTTIAWRMCHLIDCYGGRRMAKWFGLPERPSPTEGGVPGTAADALRMLAEAHEILIGNIEAIGEAELWTKIGPIGGIWAEHTKLSLVLHQVDEVIHHGAEVALIRDLYRAQHRNEDPFVLASLKADRAAIDSMLQGRSRSGRSDGCCSSGVDAPRGGNGTMGRDPAARRARFPGERSGRPGAGPPHGRNGEHRVHEAADRRWAQISMRRTRSTARRRSGGPSTSRRREMVEFLQSLAPQTS